jgi:hypothetical protein
MLHHNISIPVLMHVCHESRKVAIKTHSLSLADQTAPLRFSRIDPKKDTLFFPDYHIDHNQFSLIRGVLQFWPREVFRTLRFMALDLIIWEYCYHKIQCR